MTDEKNGGGKTPPEFAKFLRGMGVRALDVLADKIKAMGKTDFVKTVRDQLSQTKKSSDH